MVELGEVAAKIGLAALLAGLVGAERERLGKSAGLRTHMLIAVGAALLTHVSPQVGARFAGDSNAWDPARIAAEVVSGIGFIGAGTIIQSRGTVHGLTTAAGLWVAAAVGIAVGGGLYAEATVATLALLLILVGLPPLERRLLGRDVRSIVVELGRERSAADLLAVFERQRVEVKGLAVSREAGVPSADVRYRASPAEADRLATALAEAGFGLGEGSGGPLGH